MIAGPPVPHVTDWPAYQRAVEALEAGRERLVMMGHYPEVNRLARQLMWLCDVARRVKLP